MEQESMQLMEQEPKKRASKDKNEKNVEVVRVIAEDYEKDDKDRIVSIRFRIQEVHKKLRMNMISTGELNGATKSIAFGKFAFLYCPIGSTKGKSIITVTYTNNINIVKLSFE